MTDKVRNSLLLALILAYGLAVLCWGVAKSPLAPDEARTVFVGRTVMRELGVTQGNVPAQSDAMMAAYLGSGASLPAIIASADSIAGIYGARLISVMFCLLLIVSLYKTGNAPLHGGRGLLTAGTFVFLGLPLQLLSSANADACAALLLGASLLCIEHAMGLGHSWKRTLIVMAGALSLALAAMVNYAVILFVIPLILYVFLRHRFFVASAFFLLPLLGLLVLYGYFAVLPVWPAVENEVSFFRSISGAPVSPGVNIFNRASIVLAGALSLVRESMINYTAMLFGMSVVPYGFLRHRFRRHRSLRHRSLVAGVLFLLPLLCMLVLYRYSAVVPVWPSVENELAVFRSISGGSVSPWIYVYNLLNMSTLLAVIGIFHKEGGKNSVLMLLLAAPALLIHLVGSGLSAMHTAALLSLVFLAPAAALGVAQLAELFSSNNDMRFVKSFFVTAILVIICVFGIQQVKGLNKERPDLSSAVSFLKGQGSGWSTLLVDSDYGSPELVYMYYLDVKTPPVRVIPVVRGTEEERREAVAFQHPDYVVIDSYHSVRSFDQACREYQAQGFTVAATYSMPLASGVKKIRIYRKGVL